MSRRINTPDAGGSITSRIAAIVAGADTDRAISGLVCVAAAIIRETIAPERQMIACEMISAFLREEVRKGRP